jgi:hypothetical protein
MPEQQLTQNPGPQPVDDRSAPAPDRDRIAARAYELYLARGRASGRELDDWLAAERELNSSDVDREPE